MTGAELREARKAAGLSMKQAAELSGTPYRTWQDWEGGKRRVPGLAMAWLNALCSQPAAQTTRNLDLVLEAIRRAAENPNTPENMCGYTEAKAQFKALYQWGDRGRQKAWNSGIAQLVTSGRISIQGHVITIIGR